MDPFDYYILEEEKKRQATPINDTRSLDDLMMLPTSSTPRSDPLMSDIINESNQRLAAAQPTAPVQPATAPVVPTPNNPASTTQRPAQTPYQSRFTVPSDVRRRAGMQGLFANLQSLGRSMGQRGRNAPADHNAGARARSAVINDYMQRVQAEEANRQNTLRLALGQREMDLAERKQELAERPVPVDPIKRATELANAQKAQAEALIKINQVKQLGTEDQRKQAYIATIKDLAAKFKIEVPPVDKTWSTDQLEKLAVDFAEHPLKYKRARALGGVGGGVGGTGISREKNPEVATALQKAMVADSVFIDDPNEREAYAALGSRDELSKAETRVFEGIQKKAGDTKERLIKKADKWITDFNDPEKNIGQMFEAITELKSTLAKYPQVSGWNEITSSIENLGDFGQWVIDLKNVNDPAARDIMNAIRRYKEAYARAASGAAIGQLEWTNFARQLGVGAFSNPQALREGANRAERVLKSAVTRAYNANVDPRLRGYSEWSDPVKPYLLPSKAEADSVAAKYGGGE
jgi:hypothetical protein